MEDNKINFVIPNQNLQEENQQVVLEKTETVQQVETNQLKPAKSKHVFCNIENYEQEERPSFNIKIIGIGGAGCNVVRHINENYPSVCSASTLYAFNTDLGSLKLSGNLENKFLLNKDELKGYGSGGDPEVGRRAVEHDAEVIKEELKGTDVLFIIAGLGKGAGSGGAPELAKIAKELGILTVSIVNMPAVACEGNIIFNNAYNALQSLTAHTDSVTIISNEKIISNKKDVSLFNAYALANDEIASIIQDIVDIIFKPTTMNVDFADLKSFFKKNKFFMMNRVGYDATNISESTIKDALIKKIKQSFTDVDINKAEDAICNISMSKNTPANFIHFINRALAEYTNNASISLVTGIDYNESNTIQLSFLISGNTQVSEFTELSKKAEDAKWHEPVHTETVEGPISDSEYDDIVKQLNISAVPTIEIIKNKK